MTKPIDKTDPFTQEVFKFLDNLRASGKINMFGAPTVLEQAYGFDHQDARGFFIAWTETFNEDN